MCFYKHSFVCDGRGQSRREEGHAEILVMDLPRIRFKSLDKIQVSTIDQRVEALNIFVNLALFHSYFIIIVIRAHDLLQSFWIRINYYISQDFFFIFSFFGAFMPGETLLGFLKNDISL